MSQESSNTGGLGFAGALTILFVGLKLTGYVAWSWWWVLCPLWAGFALIAVVLLFMVIVAGVQAL